MTLEATVHLGGAIGFIGFAGLAIGYSVLRTVIAFVRALEVGVVYVKTKCFTR